MRGRKPETIVPGASLAAVPRAPAWLSRFAKAEWRRVVPDLVERRLITAADLGTVENFCAAQARVREIELEMRKGGKVDPVLVRAADRAMQTARQIAGELGLTPVSRSRAVIRSAEAESDADDLGLD